MFQRREKDGVVYFVFPELERLGVPHVVGTRVGGVSPEPFHSLNVSVAVGDTEENVQENRRRLSRVLGVEPEMLVGASLVHGTTIAQVTSADRGRWIPQTDALLTREARVPLFMTFADCVPVVIYDPKQRALALAHAGWRGTAAGLTMRVIAAMERVYRSRPRDLVVALGPAIGQCHYEVGTDVMEAFDVFGRGPVVFEKKGGRYYLDLVGTNVKQAEMMHVNQVLVSGYCTACHPDLFYSHRGEKGKTGRFGVIAMLS